ncbi:MAG: rod shape-determining protein MreC [bacterium]|nr:rod shape-determining protein MreC [bacterium]
MRSYMNPAKRDGIKKRTQFSLHSKLKLGVIFLGILAFFVILNITNFSKPIKNFFYLISSPVEQMLFRKGSGASNFFEGIFRSGKLMEENKNLRFENQELLSRISALNEAEKENETLRDVLNLGMKNDFELLFAQIVSKDIARDSLLIDKGLKDEIKKGFPVITGQKVLLGRIGEVYDNFSEVILVSNKESSFDAKISKLDVKEVEDINIFSTLRSTRVKEVYGVVKGGGGLKIYLDLIPREDKILKDDIITTAALGGIFPQGLLVGRVKDIKISDLDPFQKAEITPAFSLQDLDKIFIIKNFKLVAGQ